MGSVPGTPARHRSHQVGGGHVGEDARLSSASDRVLLRSRCSCVPVTFRSRSALVPERLGQKPSLTVEQPEGIRQWSWARWWLIVSRHGFRGGPRGTGVQGTRGTQPARFVQRLSTRKPCAKSANERGGGSHRHTSERSRGRTSSWAPPRAKGPIWLGQATLRRI